MSLFADAVVTYGVKRATASDGMPLEGPVLAFSTPRDIHYVSGQKVFLRFTRVSEFLRVLFLDAHI